MVIALSLVGGASISGSCRLAFRDMLGLEFRDKWVGQARYRRKGLGQRVGYVCAGHRDQRQSQE